MLQKLKTISFWKKVLWRFLYFFCLFFFVKLIIPDEDGRSLTAQIPFTTFISFIMALVFALGDNTPSNPDVETLNEIGQRGIKYYAGLFLFSTFVVILLGGVLFVFLILISLPFIDEPFTWNLAGRVLIAMMAISLLMTLVQWIRDRLIIMGRRKEPNL